MEKEDSIIVTSSDDSEPEVVTEAEDSTPYSSITDQNAVPVRGNIEGDEWIRYSQLLKRAEQLKNEQKNTEKQEDDLPTSSRLSLDADELELCRDEPLSELGSFDANASPRSLRSLGSPCFSPTWPFERKKNANDSFDSDETFCDCEPQECSG